ncbi:MAG: zinc ribbon domain-containing protein [Acidobacteriota bacterium]
MSMIYCPECGHEVSANAVACPNCAHPFHTKPPVVERRVIVAQPPEREGGVPPWLLVPLGILAVVILFIGFFVLRSTGDQGNTNLNVNVASRRTEPVQEPMSRTTTTVPSSVETQPMSPPVSTTTVPGTATSAPSAPPPDKGSVMINAKILPPRSQQPQSARGTKFYLLDKDLETILSEARVEPIEGNTLTGSIGLAAAFPDRYGDFQRAAMRAIGGHVKYSATTGTSGSANLAGVLPNEYYLFGVMRVGRGFALWSAPVSVIPGENVMNLSPQDVTEIPDTSG